MRQSTTHLVALLVLFASTVLAAPVAEEGFAVGAAREIVVTGTVFDSAANTPIPAAQVTVISDTTTDRSTTGPDGVFRVTTVATQDLGTLSIEVSAYGYQPKYVEALLRDTFRNRIDVQVDGGKVNLKARKFKASLACGSSASVELKSGEGAPVTSVCGDGLTGLEVTVRKNRIAVLAVPPYEMRVENGRIELQKVSGGRVEIRVAAAMLPR